MSAFVTPIVINYNCLHVHSDDGAGGEAFEVKKSERRVIALSADFNMQRLPFLTEEEKAKLKECKDRIKRHEREKMSVAYDFSKAQAWQVELKTYQGDLRRLQARLKRNSEHGTDAAVFDSSIGKIALCISFGKATALHALSQRYVVVVNNYHWGQPHIALLNPHKFIAPSSKSAPQNLEFK